MNFLKKLFVNKSSITKPSESKKKSNAVQISENIITYFDDFSKKKIEIKIDKIEYIYETNSQHGGAELFVQSNHQHYLSINLDGFDEFYSFLSKEFNFTKNDTTDFKDKKQVYRKKRNANFEMLSNINRQDYHLGFEIQSPNKSFLSWDLSFDEMILNENLRIEISDYDQKTFVFKYPVRVGNIILENFMFFDTNFRKDVPVLQFYADCYNKESSDKSFYDLRQKLSENLEKIEPFWERDDSSNCTFEANGMHLGMYYWYDSDYAFNSGYTSFRAENFRKYNYLLDNSAYENIISIDKHLIFEENFTDNSKYKTNPNVKNIPKQILELSFEKPIIWIDKLNDKIGFATHDQSQIFDLNRLETISIQNVAPAKSGGGCYLDLCFNDKKSSLSIFEGNYKELDKYQIQMEELLEIRVDFKEEYSDC